MATALVKIIVYANVDHATYYRVVSRFPFPGSKAKLCKEVAVQLEGLGGEILAQITKPTSDRVPM